MRYGDYFGKTFVQVVHYFPDDDVTNLGSCTLQSIEIDKRPDEEFRQGFMGLQHEGAKTNNSFPCLLPEKEWLVP